MHFKNRINHVNPIYAEKLSFFADIFEFTILNLGQIGFPALENHRALLEKIKYQLENYTNFTRKYINHHFDHKYLQKDDPIIKNYYSTEMASIVSARNVSMRAGNYASEAERQLLINEINFLLNKLENALFQNALDKIINAILCESALVEHQHIKVIEYFTPILVSEFAFAGFNTKELRNIIEIISPSEIELSGDQVETKAVLPPDLLEKKNNTEEFFKEAKEYLGNRNLKQQLESIYFLLVGNRKPKTLLFKIGSVRSFKSFSLENNGVLMFNALPQKYEETKKGYPNFFRQEAQAYAETTVLAGDKTTALNMAIRKINEELNYLNVVYKIDAELEKSHFIYEDNGKRTYHINFAGVVQDPDNVRFEGGKMTEYLLGIDTHLARKAIQMERIYFEALSAFRDEDKLVALWRYLESFFDYEGYNAQEVQEKVSKAVSLDSITSFIFLNHNLGLYILMGSVHRSDNEYFGITREEFQTLIKEKDIAEVDFVRMDEIIDHPYVTERLKWQIQSSDEVKQTLAKDYYLDMLKEVYEQRNLIEHSSVVMDKALMKLLPALEAIVFKFRNIISKEIKKNTHANYKDLINSF